MSCHQAPSVPARNGSSTGNAPIRKTSSESPSRGRLTETAGTAGTAGTSGTGVALEARGAKRSFAAGRRRWWGNCLWSASERRQGAEGEREVVVLPRAHGWPRGHRNFGSGSAGGSDIVRGPKGTVLEVTRHRRRTDLPRAIAQTEAAAGNHALPIVAHRRDGEPWRATLPLEDLLELLAWRERG